MPPPDAQLTQAISQIERLAAAGEFEKALAGARTLVAARPDAHQAHTALSNVLDLFGRYQESREALEQALFLLGDGPASILPRRTHARALLRLNLPEEALASIDRALKANPGAEPLIAARATVLIELGRLDDADTLLAGVFEKDPTPAPEFAAVRARLREHQKDYQRGADELRGYVESARIPADLLAPLHFHVGSLLEKAERYDAAMDWYTSANELAAGRFDPDKHDALIDRIIAAWTPESIAKVKRGDASTDLILIVGMPRSGTSLAERVIAGHPTVQALGESNMMSWAWKRAFRGLAKGGEVPGPDAIPDGRLAEVADWMRREYALLADGRPRIVTKNPFDFLRVAFAPLVVPGVRIVHSLRDPRDVCLSNFALQFTHPLAFAQRLEWIGRYYQTYRRLMDHWASLVHATGAEIYDLRYERLTADPEPETRRLLGFLGLEWDDACLSPQRAKVVTWTASRDQVTRPINASSVARHQRFGDRLKPLFDALGPYANGVDPTDT